MSSFKIQETYEASADEVWKRVGDFADMSWMPGVESCEVDGEGVGSVRKVGMPGGTSVEETLEAHDEATRSLSYSIAASPLPLQNYLATLSVNEEGSGCSVESPSNS